MKSKRLVAVLAALSLASATLVRAQENVFSEIIQQQPTEYVGIAYQVVPDTQEKVKIRIKSGEGNGTGFITLDPLLYEAEIFQFTDKGTRNIVITTNLVTVVKHEYHILKPDCNPQRQLRSCYAEPRYVQKSFMGDYTSTLQGFSDIEHLVKKGVPQRIYVPSSILK